MKTKQFFFKSTFMCAIILFVCMSKSANAQVLANPYMISNGSCFSVNIAYEVTHGCTFCNGGSVTIPAGGNAFIGTGCPSIQDVHIQINAINGNPVSPIVVGAPSNCMDPGGPQNVNFSTAATASGVSIGSGCLGIMQCTTGGTHIQ